MNKQSGWKALTGTTDFGKISNSDDENCVLAFDIFIDRILNYVGSYYVKLGGRVDALVFAGGIGEKGAKLRAKIVEGCFCLGFSLDSQKNNVDLTETVTDLSKADSKHKILVCRTDEQASRCFLESKAGC